jgi:hypothetical protein
MAEKIDLVQVDGLETINGWISGVTREPFLTEREAVNRDNELLEKYNLKQAKDSFEKMFDELRTFFKKALNENESKIKDSEEYYALLDLSEAVFNRKVSRSNRYADVNPFEIIFALEIYAKGFFSELVSRVYDSLNDFDNAVNEWKKENQGQYEKA